MGAGPVDRRGRRGAGAVRVPGRNETTTCGAGEAARREPLAQAIDAYQKEMIVYAFHEVEASKAMMRRCTTRNPLMRWMMLSAIPWLRSLTGRGLTLEGD
jgi:hypothetical protein